MSASIITNVGRLGAVGGITAIALQLIQWFPPISEKITKIEVQQGTIMTQHEVIGQELGEYFELSVKLQRANCLNTAETKEEKLNCNQ